MASQLFERRDVSFCAETERCAAWMYAPTHGEGPFACVVMAHGFGGIREARLDAYAERFAAAGYAVFVFDYRHWGASGGEPRQVLDVRRQLVDWLAAHDFVRMLPEVDNDRIALWGTSFSGGHVITTAARGASVAAVIAQVPFVDGIAQTRSMPPGQAIRLAAAAIRDRLRSALRLRPLYIRIVGPPGSPAALTASGAEGALLELVPPAAVERLAWSNAVAARVLLQVPFYRPIRYAAHLSCPLLVLAGDNDALVPPGPAIKAAGRARMGELERYPMDHFDPYTGERFEQVVARQIAFLARHLPAS